MNRRFFISSSVAVGGVALLSRLPSWARTGLRTNADEDVRVPSISATNPSSRATFNSRDSSISRKITIIEIKIKRNQESDQDRC